MMKLIIAIVGDDVAYEIIKELSVHKIRATGRQDRRTLGTAGAEIGEFAVNVFPRQPIILIHPLRIRFDLDDRVETRLAAFRAQVRDFKAH